MMRQRIGDRDQDEESAVGVLVDGGCLIPYGGIAAEA